MISQQRLPPRPQSQIVSLKDAYSNQQPSQPNRVKGARPAPHGPPRIVGITGDSVHPIVQDSEAQVGPDTWITEVRTYLKDNILPDDSASADRIVHLAKRYKLVEGNLYWRGANGILMWCISQDEG
jgi:hypothetical protein